MKLPEVVAVTDGELTDDALVGCADRMMAAVPPGALAIQLRVPARTARQAWTLGARLAAACELRGAPFYVNDRIDVARSLDAAGVHLGRRSIRPTDARLLVGPRAFVSISVHELDELDGANADGATAALVSPIFATPRKGSSRGPSFIADARERAAGLPLYALGGVDASNAGACVRAGAHGIAAIRSLWRAADPAAAAIALVAAVEGARSR